MQSLLSASRAIFDLQQIQLERLMTLLEKSHSKEYHGSNGYEEIISRCYATMTEQEKELHGIIRAYTEHSLRKVNQAMSDWLKADTTFKTGNVSEDPSIGAEARSTPADAIGCPIAIPVRRHVCRRHLRLRRAGNNFAPR